MINPMDTEYIPIKVVGFTKERLKMERKVVLESKSGPMVLNIKENSRMAKLMVKVITNGEMAQSIMASGVMM